jgi:hypothetical protein
VYAYVDTIKPTERVAEKDTSQRSYLKKLGIAYYFNAQLPLNGMRVIYHDH